MFELTLALIIFLFPLAYSPGPGNLFFSANGARFGWKHTLLANLGYHLATLLVTLLIGLGFTEMAQHLSFVFEVIGYLGIAYVMHLAWKFFRAGMLGNDVSSQHIGFWDGVILLLLNPKAYMIIVLLFSQFLSVQHGMVNVFFITIIFTVNNFVAFLIWAIFGDVLISKFRNEKYAKTLNGVFGCVLMLVAIWMLINHIKG